jgi:hypothetical protein
MGWGSGGDVGAVPGDGKGVVPQTINLNRYLYVTALWFL